MTDAIQKPKVRGEILHRQIQSGNSRGLARVRALAEFRCLSEEQLAANVALIERRDCLNVIANELGFASWPEASGFDGNSGRQGALG